MSQYHIVVSLAQQALLVYREGERLKPLKKYIISSAKKGVGGNKNSGKTPLGKHIVRAMIGQSAPENTVFVGRRPTGEIYSFELSKQYPERDWILTRIIWLSGLEKGKNRLGNVDTMQRYIYIHGTPDTEPMGEPLSHGCIRMRNKEITELFNLIEPYTPVEIKV